jgi:DNA-binding transcriptional LysR family regulator
VQVPLNALRAFDAVVRTGSFKGAAQLLCVTQSAISHQVRHLEDWLGRPLFDRTGPRPRLLPEAEDLARVAALSLDGIAAACARLGPEARGGPLVIAAIPSVALCWLIPRLAGFRATHPEIELRIVYAFHGQDIDFSEVDLAFVYAAGPLVPSPGTVTELFMPGAAVPVASPTLAAMHPEDMQLLHDADEEGWRLWFARAGQAAPAQFAGPVFQDFNLLRAAALAGQGAALCPEAMIKDDLDAGRLCQLSDISVNEHTGYHLLRAQGRIRQGATAFRDWAMGRARAGARL